MLAKTNRLSSLFCGVEVITGKLYVNSSTYVFCEHPHHAFRLTGQQRDMQNRAGRQNFDRKETMGSA